MASSISTLNILLTGTAAGLVSAFAQGKEAAGSFGESISSTFENIGGILEGVGIALTAEGIKDFLQDADTRIVQLAHSAAELGVTTDALTRLQFAAKEAGVDAEQLTTAFAKMENGIGKAVTQGGAAAQAFTDLGLDINKISNEKPDQAFTEIAQAISQLQSPFERTQAAVAIFGKSGAQLLPLLNQGAAGIAHAGEEADKLGITLNSVDAQKVLDANNAVGQLGDVVEGVGNQILVDLAPTILSISEKLKQWLIDGNVVKTGLDYVWKGIVFGAEYIGTEIKLVEGVFEEMGAIGAFALGGLVEDFALLAKAGSWVINKLFGTHIDTSGIDDAAKKLLDTSKKLYNEAGQDVWDGISGHAAKKAADFLTAANADATKKAKDALDQQSGGNVTEHIQAKVEKGKSLFGELAKYAGDAWDKVKKVVEDAAKKAEEADRKLNDEAKEAIEKSLSPLQKEQEELSKLIDLYSKGKLSKEQFDQAKAKVEADFDKDVKASPEAALAGTAEAFKLEAEINNRAHGITKDDTGKQQVEEAKKHTELFQQLIAKIGGGPTLHHANLGV